MWLWQFDNNKLLVSDGQYFALRHRLKLANDAVAEGLEPGCGNCPLHGHCREACCSKCKGAAEALFMLSAVGGMSGDSVCTQEMFGSFLSLHDMPAPHQLSNVLRQASKAVASLKQTGLEVELRSDAFIPLLHMLLPDAALPTVSMLANLV